MNMVGGGVEGETETPRLERHTVLKARTAERWRRKSVCIDTCRHGSPSTVPRIRNSASSQRVEEGYFKTDFPKSPDIPKNRIIPNECPDFLKGRRRSSSELAQEWHLTQADKIFSRQESEDMFVPSPNLVSPIPCTGSIPRSARLCYNDSQTSKLARFSKTSYSTKTDASKLSGSGIKSAITSSKGASSPGTAPLRRLTTLVSVGAAKIGTVLGLNDAEEELSAYTSLDGHERRYGLNDSFRYSRGIDNNLHLIHEVSTDDEGSTDTTSAKKLYAAGTASSFQDVQVMERCADLYNIRKRGSASYDKLQYFGRNQRPHKEFTGISSPESAIGKEFADSLLNPDNAGGKEFADNLSSPESAIGKEFADSLSSPDNAEGKEFADGLSSPDNAEGKEFADSMSSPENAGDKEFADSLSGVKKNYMHPALSPPRSRFLSANTKLVSAQSNFESEFTPSPNTERSVASLSSGYIEDIHPGNEVDYTEQKRDSYVLKYKNGQALELALANGEVAGVSDIPGGGLSKLSPDISIEINSVLSSRQTNSEISRDLHVSDGTENVFLKPKRVSVPRLVLPVKSPSTVQPFDDFSLGTRRQKIGSPRISPCIHLSPRGMSSRRSSQLSSRHTQNRRETAPGAPLLSALEPKTHEHFRRSSISEFLSHSGPIFSGWRAPPLRKSSLMKIHQTNTSPPYLNNHFDLSSEDEEKAELQHLTFIENSQIRKKLFSEEVFSGEESGNRALLFLKSSTKGSSSHRLKSKRHSNYRSLLRKQVRASLSIAASEYGRKISRPMLSMRHQESMCSRRSGEKLARRRHRLSASSFVRFNLQTRRRSTVIYRFRPAVPPPMLERPNLLVSLKLIFGVFNTNDPTYPVQECERCRIYLAQLGGVHRRFFGFIAGALIAELLRFVPLLVLTCLTLSVLYSLMIHHSQFCRNVLFIILCSPAIDGSDMESFPEISSDFERIQKPSK